MKVVFVGDIYESLADTAKKYDPNARLVSHSNGMSGPGTYYTSLADCGLEEFYKILNLSDEIHYCPPETWSDSASGVDYPMKFWTEKYLYFFSMCSDKIIKGYQPPIINRTVSNNPYIKLSDQRKTDESQIWVAGCSISHGTGVNKDQRYGELLSQKLKREVSWLTYPGSSIQWARDQIICSDIRKDDLVFWGLTCANRFPYFYENKVIHVNVSSYVENPQLQDFFSLDKLDDDDQIYQCINSIYQVYYYCKAKQAKLYMLDMHQNTIRKFCYALDNFDTILDYGDVFIDHGSDNKHPGPLQHKFYAEKFLQMMENK